MSGNRKAAEAIILKGLSLLDPSGKNTELTQAFFKNMSDQQFDNYMKAIEEGRDYVSLVYTNLQKSPITTDNNLEVAKKLNYDFFHRIWITDSATGMTYLTNQKHLVVDLPTRRQIQTLENKISIPEDNKHVDDLTDQPTGVSKGSALSFPEILVLHAQGNDKGIEEMIKYRGGDVKGMNALDKSIYETGGAKMESLEKLDTRVKSTETLTTLLKAMHIDNNFAG